MGVYTAIVDNAGAQEARSVFATVVVTITTGNTTGSAAHNMGRAPVRVGKPNPNRDEGYNARASADATNVTVTLDAPISASTDFTVEVYGV